MIGLIGKRIDEADSLCAQTDRRLGVAVSADLGEWFGLEIGLVEW
jgi:hypothetical protein